MDLAIGLCGQVDAFVDSQPGLVTTDLIQSKIDALS